MAKIVVVGSLNMDLVAKAPRIPVIGETIIGDAYFAEPGGKGRESGICRSASRRCGRHAWAHRG